VIRTQTSSGHGDYSFPALTSGEYEVSVEAERFQRIVRTASVEAGATTMADFALRLGDVKESVTVDNASPQIRYDSHSLGGVITGKEIQNLPLNGRSFLELAKLEPAFNPPRTLPAIGRWFRSWARWATPAEAECASTSTGAASWRSACSLLTIVRSAR
jgi:hypothetical protein